MDKVTETKVEKIKRTHTFYCDSCNKELGQFEEYEDGWYENIGEYAQNVYIKHVGWFRLHRHLCQECANKINDEIVAKLLETGFEAEMR